jgi:UDP-N-acetyl-D-glucosamine dehydrogenase
VELAAEALNDRGRALKGARIGVLGVAFKPNVRDPRNSPAAGVIAGLRARGAEVAFHDPHVDRFTDADGTSLDSVPLDEVLAMDLVVVVTPHRAIDWGRVYERAALVVDTVNSSGGRELADRQVLRLGAGWSPAARPVRSASA